MLRLLVLIVLSVVLIFKTNGARILCVFPTPSFSHQIVYRTLTEALAKRGHDVVVITTHPFPPGEKPVNVTEINMYDVSNRIWQGGLSKIFHETGDEMRVAKTFTEMFTNIFEKQIQSKAVQDLIKNKRDSFDLLLLESIIVPLLGLGDVFSAPVIQTCTSGPIPGTYDLFRAPVQPLLYPIAINNRLYNLTFWESTKNLYKNVIYRYAVYSHEFKGNEMIQRHISLDISPIGKLYEEVNLYFQAVYPLWMNNPPVPRGIVYLEGLHQKSPKTLPQKLQEFLDSSKNGFIYVSFGSNVHPSLLAPEKIDMMARVFSKLPYEILWKRDQAIQIETAKNIQVSTWFPQSDLLYHPKIKLFVTHGGLQSTEEAITAGVPLIGIPIFGDQWMHTENYVHLRIGLQLDWHKLSEEQLTTSIANVIGDKSYKENVVRLGNVINDQPQSPLEQATWWTEYVLKHGSARHLLPASANISYLEYFEVELVTTVVLAVILVFYSLTYIVLRLARSICRNKTNDRHFKIV